MARIFGFASNRPELGVRVLARSSEVLRVTAEEGKPLGWGVGFYQAGEVLLRRRPLDERDEIDIGEVTSEIRTDMLLGHVRNPTVGNLRTENTHPFRYRQWLFAHTGTISGFSELRERLLESQPEFLKKNVRGDTDSEVFFYLFLSFLHDAGHLGNGITAPEDIIKALRSSIALVDRLTDGEPNGGDALVANGEYMVAMHRTGTMAHRYLRGGKDKEIEELLRDSVRGTPRTPNIAAVRCSVVAAQMNNTPPGWQPSPKDSFLTLTRTEEPVIEAI